MRRKAIFMLHEFPYFIDYIEHYKNMFLPIHKCDLGILKLNEVNYRLIFMISDVHLIRNIEDVIFIQIIEQNIYINFETDSFLVTLDGNIFFKLSIILKDSRLLRKSERLYFNRKKLLDISKHI
jgi:hypothetical protein